MKNIELAKWLHDNYEEIAKAKDWNTQESCKVEFATLPDANKQVMIEVAERLLNFDLLRLHLVSKSPSCKKCDGELRFKNVFGELVACEDCYTEDKNIHKASPWG